MRRDILAGCLGLIFTALIVYSKRNPVPYKPVEYSPLLQKPDFPATTQKITIHPASDKIHSDPQKPKGNTYKVPLPADEKTELDDLMRLPLEGGEFLYDPSEGDDVPPKTVFIKYVRFQCTKLRNSDKIVLGGVRFFYGTTPIPFSKMQIWNPHTGESSKYTGDAWTDSDQLSVIFCFAEPLEMNGYELRSSSESADHDPTQWKMEGSMNGSFWTMLDDRTWSATAFPLERNTIMSYIMKDFV